MGKHGVCGGAVSYRKEMEVLYAELWRRGVANLATERLCFSYFSKMENRNCE